MSEFETERNREIFFEESAKKAVKKAWSFCDLEKIEEDSEVMSDDEQIMLASFFCDYMERSLVSSSELVEELFAEAGETFGLTVENSGEKMTREILKKIIEKFVDCVENGKFTGDFADIIQIALDEFSEALL